jgi:regulator of sigma D
MCGVTLEGACRLQGAKKDGLNKMLEEMKNEGKIDSRLGEWADSLRQVRNSASHFNDEAVTRQDADDCLAFNEALLDYLHVLAARFNSMQERRASGNEEEPQ